MTALITNDNSRYSKPTKDISPEKFHNNLSIISPSGYSFHPFRNIIHSKQAIYKTKKYGERAHKINTLDIKDVTIQHGLLRHLLPPSNRMSCSLALFTFCKCMP